MSIINVAAWLYAKLCTYGSLIWERLRRDVPSLQTLLGDWGLEGNKKLKNKKKVRKKAKRSNKIRAKENVWKNVRAGEKFEIFVLRALWPVIPNLWPMITIRWCVIPNPWLVIHELWSRFRDLWSRSRDLWSRTDQDCNLWFRIYIISRTWFVFCFSIFYRQCK